MTDTSTLPNNVQDVPIDWTLDDDDAFQQAATNGTAPSSPTTQPVIKLAQSCRELFAKDFIERESIAFGLERGEIGMLNALPNAGKTTICLNALISLCIGREFPPVVAAGKPRRVLVIDGETRARRLQGDLRWLVKDLSQSEKELVKDNLFVICEAEVNGEPLSLTTQTHLLYLANEALQIKPDFVVLDTFASLFHVYSENDNGEQNRKVWRPLQKVARGVDAAFLLTHHIGKRQAEEGATPDRVYAGRGASSSGGSARAIWNITKDPVTAGLITLSCAKIKATQQPKDTLLQLDDSRWFRPVGRTEYKSTYDLLLEAVTEEMSRKEIIDAMRGVASGRTIDSLIEQALKKGHLAKARRGRFAPVKESEDDVADVADE